MVRRGHNSTDLPVVLSFNGSDSSGGAGIQADVKTIEAHGGFATTVVTSLAAENTLGVESVHVPPPEEIGAQYRAVMDDLDVTAIKIGMLAVEPIIRQVAADVRDVGQPVVVDPVMVAASGDPLLEEGAEEAYEEVVAEADVVTPNVDETAILTGVEVDDRESAIEAGERIVEMGATAALITGGHLDGETIVDTLVTDDDTFRFEHPRVDTNATHGSGCTISSAIATRLAQGDSVPEAVEESISFIESAIRYHVGVGGGHGPVHHMVGIRERAERHSTAESVEALVETFVDRDASPLVPQVGTNVAGATSYAESTDQVAAVEGRIVRTRSGVRPSRGVRFGVSSHVARFLLAARESDPRLRYAANCKLDDATEAALADLDVTAASFDRGDEPIDHPGDTMEWAASHLPETDGPVALFDHGAVGKEPMIRIVARTPDELVGTMTGLLDAVE